MTLGHPTRINQSSSAFNVQINIEIENDSQLAASRTPGACMSHIFSAHVGRLGDERRGEGMWRWTQFGCKRKLGKTRVNTSKQIGYSYQVFFPFLAESLPHRTGWTAHRVAVYKYGISLSTCGGPVSDLESIIKLVAVNRSNFKFQT